MGKEGTFNRIKNSKWKYDLKTGRNAQEEEEDYEREEGEEETF